MTTMQPEIARAVADDIDGIEALLTRNHLPIAGWREHVATTQVARQDGQVVGSAALEPYADGALMRSVAVAPELQGRGLGRDLTEAALRLAGELHAPAVYLLTTTASDFFLKFGFEPIGRADVPASVQTSIEFTSACPATATVMRKTLVR
jgi:amino-acid N-acetyltransferase